MALTTRDHMAPAASSPLPEPPRVEVSGRASVGGMSTPSPASQGRHSVPSPAPRPFDPAMVSGRVWFVSRGRFGGEKLDIKG